MKVLLIDEDAAAIDGLSTAFGRCKVPPEITVAASVGEGLRRLRQEPGAYAALLGDPNGWPGRLRQAIAELRMVAPETILVALLDPRCLLGPEEVLNVGFDEAFNKHPRAYPVIARLVGELMERGALRRQQLRLSQGRADAEVLLTALLAASDAGMALLDAEGRITVANGQLGRLVGKPLADLLQHPVWPLFAAESAETLRSMLEGGCGTSPVGLALALNGAAGSTLVNARLVARELAQGQRAAALSLRASRPLPAGMAARAAQPVAEAAPEILRAALRARRTAPVIVRIRPADGSRLVGRTGVLPPAVTQILQAALRTALRELLGEGDLLFTAADDLHLLLAEESALEAMRRLGRTAPALRHALQGSPQLAHELLAQGGAALVEQLEALCRLQVLAAPIELAPEDVGSDDLPLLLATRLQAEEVSLGGETLGRLNELRMHASCELRMVQDQDGAPSALCLPRVEGTAAAGFAALMDEAETRPDLALHLGLVMLELTVEALAREVDHEGALAVIDLHFSVLAQRRLASRFLDRCRALPHDRLRSLAVNLLGVPPGAYAPKFVRITGALPDLFRLRALTIRDIRAELVDLEVARIGLVIVDFRDLEPLLGEREVQVQALIRRLHRSHARLLVRHVPRGAAVELREAFGVDLTSAA